MQKGDFNICDPSCNGRIFGHKHYGEKEKK